VDQESSPAGQELNDEANRTPEQVRAEIEETREQLGETVAALAEKTDVKGQAKRATEQAKANVTEKVAAFKETAGEKKQEFVASAQEATPESLGDAGTQARGLARENSTVLIAAATFGLGLIIGRRSGR
jgi:Skp family chaperone for outer membrane proteins